MITGHINRKWQIVGTVKKENRITGIIPRTPFQPSIIDGDHKFITVDLVKFNTRLDNVPSVCAIVPFSSAVSQPNTGNILIDLSPFAVSVNQVTAVTDTEAYNNVNP